MNKCKKCKKTISRNETHEKNVGYFHQGCWYDWKLKSLWKKAWKVCSEYIRMRDGGVCYTCGEIKDYKEMDAGHFKHGKFTPIYFHEKNIHCQCTKCNRHLSGNRDVYLRRIQRDYGMETGDWLMAEGDKVHKYTIKELEDVITYYEKIKQELQ